MEMYSLQKIKETFPFSVCNHLKSMALFLDVAANFHVVATRLDRWGGGLTFPQEPSTKKNESTNIAYCAHEVNNDFSFVCPNVRQQNLECFQSCVIIAL
jgi:hypothetical protein